MSRSVLLAAALAVCGCIDPTDESPDHATAVQSVGGTAIHRENLGGDVWHTTFDVPVGSTPNARLRLHRVVREKPNGLPRPTTDGVMLMHGDFSSIESNFIPSSGGGMAKYLAEQDLDVWGFDRRWSSAPADADLSDFGEMGLAQELDDTGIALAVARAVRIATGAGGDRMVLAGFSRGGQLAYAYTSIEAKRPSVFRHVKGLVPLDVLYVFAPEDDEFRLKFCESAALEFADLAAGIVDSPNDFFILLGELALSAPDDPSPIFDGFTNAEAVQFIAGNTYLFFQPTPFYHLAGPGYAALETIATWFADASPHQALREAAESDQLWCGEPPFAVDAPASRIRVPIFYLGAAGGYGDHGLYSLAQTSSTDITTLVIRKLPAEQELEDYGHGDILFAADAAEVAWQPLAEWIRSH
jgi:pimeloyl-ACP methyl ester carboxylesterase